MPIPGKITHTQLFEQKKFTIVEPRAPLPPYTITRLDAAIIYQPMNVKQMPRSLAASQPRSLAGAFPAAFRPSLLRLAAVLIVMGKINAFLITFKFR